MSPVEEFVFNKPALLRILEADWDGWATPTLTAIDSLRDLILYADARDWCRTFDSHLASTQVHNGAHRMLVRRDSVSYWRDGVLHRDDGPAYVSNECDEYWINGRRHRVDGGPAYVSRKELIWYKDGEPVRRCRLDMPGYSSADLAFAASGRLEE